MFYGYILSSIFLNVFLIFVSFAKVSVDIFHRTRQNICRLKWIFIAVVKQQFSASSFDNNLPFKKVSIVLNIFIFLTSQYHWILCILWNVRKHRALFEVLYFFKFDSLEIHMIVKFIQLSSGHAFCNL